MKRMIFLVAILTILSLFSGIFQARGADTGAVRGGLTGDSDAAALEIVCTGLRKGDIAVFDVYGPEGRKIYSVALQGVGSDKAVRRRIIGLKPGLYRVKSANWDWTYDKSPVSLELKLNAGESIPFSFSADKRSNLPLNYEDGKLNVFNNP